MHEKAVKVLNCIYDHQPISAPKIQARLKAEGTKLDVKTIYTYVRQINQFFDWLGCDEPFITSVHKFGYVIAHPLFSEGEQLFLSDHIRFSPLLNQVEKNVLQAKLAKLAGMPYQPEDQKVEKGPTAELFVRLTTIAKAIRMQKTLLFEYLDYDLKDDGRGLRLVKRVRNHGNYSRDPRHQTYLVSPYELVMAKGQYYLVGYNEKHPDNLTVYRLDRMDKVRSSQEPFIEKPENIDIEQLKAQLVNMFIGDRFADVRLRFHHSIFKAVIDQFGSEHPLSRAENGDPIILLKDFQISEGLISWILMMGSQIEVLSPLSLRQLCIERLQAALNQYVQP